MSFLKLKHSHEWETVYASRWGHVEHCECGEFQTRMAEMASGKEVLVPGNLLASLYTSRIFILCGTNEEFVEAVSMVKKKVKISEDQIRRLYHVDQISSWLIPPTIYLWGTWYSNELCQTEAVQKALNGWL